MVQISCPEGWNLLFFTASSCTLDTWAIQTSNLKSFHPEILKESNHILRNYKNADIGNLMYGIPDITTPGLSFYEFGKFLWTHLHTFWIIRESIDFTMLKPYIFWNLTSIDRHCHCSSDTLTHCSEMPASCNWQLQMQHQVTAWVLQYPQHNRVESPRPKGTGNP